MRQVKNILPASAGLAILMFVVIGVSVRTAVAGGALSSTPTRDVENGVRDRAASRCLVQFTEGIAGTGRSLITVPAGKRLVIEYISARALLQPNQRPRLRILSQIGGHSIDHFIPFTQLTLLPDALFDNVRMIAGEPLQLYADPGTPVEAFFERDGDTAGTARCEVIMSGHFVTL